MNNSDILIEYYDKIKHFKVVGEQVQDMELIDNTILQNKVNKTESVLAQLYYKYYNVVNEIGKTKTGLIAEKGNHMYKDKTEDDLIDDAIYLSRCILVYALKQAGIFSDIKSVLKEFELNEFDITDFN